MWKHKKKQKQKQKKLTKKTNNFWSRQVGDYKVKAESSNRENHYSEQQLAAVLFNHVF